MQVVKAVLARDDADAREFRLLSHDEVLKVNPALRGSFEAGPVLWSRRGR